MKYGIVYIWRDRKHKRYYIGCHWGIESDGYICSSTWMKQAYNKRPADFKRRILSIIKTTRKDMFDEEAKWQNLIKADELRVRYYNIKRHGDRHWSSSKEQYQNVQQKISNTMKEKHNDTEYRKIYEAGQAKRDYTHSEVTKEKRRASMVNTMSEKFPVEDRKKRLELGSDELKTKLSEASKKRWEQPGAKEKQAEISRKLHTGKQHRLGHINNSEHRRKISESLKGKKHSPERIKKMADSKRGTTWSPEKKAAHSIRIKQMWAERKGK